MISSPGRGRSIGLGGAAIRPCTGFQVFKIGEIQARKSPCSQLFNAIRPTASTAVCDPPFIFDLSLTVVRACSGLAETTGTQLPVPLAFVVQSLVRSVRCTAYPPFRPTQRSKPFPINILGYHRQNYHTCCQIHKSSTKLSLTSL